MSLSKDSLCTICVYFMWFKFNSEKSNYLFDEMTVVKFKRDQNIKSITLALS